MTSGATAAVRGSALSQPILGRSAVSGSLAPAAMPPRTARDRAIRSKFPTAQFEPLAWASRRLGGRRSRRRASAHSWRAAARSRQRESRARRRPVYRRCSRSAGRAVEPLGPLDATARATSSSRISARSASPRSASRTAFSPAITSRSSKARALPSDDSVPLYRRPRDSAGRRAAGRHSADKGQASASASVKRRSRPITIAPRSRTARWPAAISKSAGSRIRSTLLRRRSRARCACGSRTARCCGSITTRTNGHPYTAVGRILIERSIIPREEMSMQKIREWMEAIRTRARSCGGRTSRMCSSARPRSARRRADGRAGRVAHARPLDRGRPQAAHLRHAVLHRRAAADRSPKKPDTNSAG